MAKVAIKKSGRPKNSTCDCFSKVNAELESKSINTRLRPSLQLSFTTGKSRVLPMLVVDKADSSKREPTKMIVCAYYPFCGKKYPDEID